MSELSSITFIPSNFSLSFENQVISLIKHLLLILGTIKKFVEYFKKYKGKNTLSYETYIFYSNFYKTGDNQSENEYDLNNYLKKLKSFNKFVGDGEINPCNILILILDKLLEESSKKNLEPEMNKYDKTKLKEVIKKIEHLKQRNNSYLKEIFNFFQIKTIICSENNNNNNNEKNNRTLFFEFNNFFTFSNDISESYGNLIAQQKSILTIQDCINNMMCSKTIKFYCIKCSKYHESKMHCKFYQLSDVFIVLLDKLQILENNFSVINIALEIQETLDLGNLMANPNNGSIYELIGILSVTYDELGINLISFCKSYKDNEWNEYSNDKFKKNDIKSILTNLKEEKSIPCILIYSKKI